MAVALFERLLPRQLEIIYEINRRFLDDVRRRYPGDEARAARVSLIEEGPEQKVRMANLAIVGSHSTNGVAAIHSGCCATTTVKDLAEMFPERFNNKTNGVTPRRWLLLANPALSTCITDAIGEGWITDCGQIAKLKPFADDPGLPRHAFRRAKRDAKTQFADWLKSTSGQTVDPDSIFDCQVKRIHEYKRQMLNALRIVVLYNRLRANPNLEMRRARSSSRARRRRPITSPSSSSSSSTIWPAPSTAIRRCAAGSRSCSCQSIASLAERLIPASDVSNQISTAGYEASGTSNMKFMMNGALTVGTRDGATIEMAEEAGARTSSCSGSARVPTVSAPFIMNFMLLVPLAS